MLFEIDAKLISEVKHGHTSTDTIPTINVSDLTYTSFFSNYMLPNLPCIIKGITDNWECSRLWITDDEVNLDYLEERYGLDTVQVYQCKERFYNTQKCFAGSFKDYLDSFKENVSRVSILTTNEYVKNWHLKLNHPEDNFYEVPIFFASDWLNEFSVNCSDDDYRFVYMGPIETWTPFHSDVFSSYSWSANIYGKKRWLIVPPGEEEHMKDTFGNLPYDLESRTSGCPGTSTKNVPKKFIEVIQNAGEAIFIPSGWHHQVHNLTYTISVNHNWVNGCNIESMFEALVKTLADVKEEIKDCEDMEDFEDHCQLMLNSLFGMDYKTFYKFLTYIATKRIEMIKNLCSKVIFHGHEIGPNHILFDLQALKNVLERFVKCQEISVLSSFAAVDKTPTDLLKEITNVLQG